MSSITYRTFTNTSAQNYQRFFVPVISIPVAAELLRRADLKPGERVLDVGCGTGAVTRLAAERVGPTGTVTGLDAAPDMVDVATSEPAATGARIEWHVGDATSLPLPDSSYDVVLCQMALMFVEDRAAAVREMRRVLVPGGRVVINTPGTIQPPLRALEQAIIDHISPELGGFVGAVFSMSDPDALAELLRDAELTDVSAGSYTTTFRLPPPEEFLWQYINLTPMGPFVEQASEAAQLALEQQVVEAWQPFVVGDHSVYDQPMVIASGRR